MDDLSFLIHAPKGFGRAIIYKNPTDSIEISDLNLQLLADASPAFAALFELDDYVDLDTLEVPFTSTAIFLQECPSAIISLLRFCYLGDYRLSDKCFDQPCSILWHMQMYKLGERFQIERLREDAYLNLLKETELSCSNGHAVIDLCEAIRFLYLELPHAEAIQETIAGYCVTCFDYHRLNCDEAFRQTAFECPRFLRSLSAHILQYQALDYRCAQSIFQMPMCGFPGHRSPLLEVVTAADFMCQFHASETTVRPSQMTRRWREPAKNSTGPFVVLTQPTDSRSQTPIWDTESDTDSEPLSSLIFCEPLQGAAAGVLAACYDSHMDAAIDSMSEAQSAASSDSESSRSSSVGSGRGKRKADGEGDGSRAHKRRSSDEEQTSLALRLKQAAPTSESGLPADEAAIVPGSSHGLVEEGEQPSSDDEADLIDLSSESEWSFFDQDDDDDVEAEAT